MTGSLLTGVIKIQTGQNRRPRKFDCIAKLVKKLESITW